MPPKAQSVTLSCPAKINLTLAIHGRRPDGFHSLHSIVAQTAFSDSLTLEWDPCGNGQDEVAFDWSAVDLGSPGFVTGVKERLQMENGDSSIHLALRVFREKAALHGGQFSARLVKRIPVGAGLGGGSSDGAAALNALRQIFADPLDWESLYSRLGSDCRIFVRPEPVLMEGRGERISPLQGILAGRLSGQEVILFKPWFPIWTAEAYRRLAGRGLYTPQEEARDLLKQWREHPDRVFPPAHNDFQRLLEFWMPSLAIVLRRLCEEHGLDARLSGSGSACFVIAPAGSGVDSVLTDELERAWGKGYWMERTRLN